MLKKQQHPGPSAITTPSQYLPTWNSQWNIPQRSFSKCWSVEPLTGFVLVQLPLLRPLLLSFYCHSSSVRWGKKSDFKLVFFLILSPSKSPSRWGCLMLSPTQHSSLSLCSLVCTEALGSLPDPAPSCSVPRMVFLFLTHRSSQIVKVI